METVKNAANFVGEKAQEVTATGQKETNKNVAKDSDASLGTRASAAKDAVGNKVDETSHSAQAEGDKQKATH